MKASTKKPKKSRKSIREEILISQLDSFKIEGIQISRVKAKSILKKVEISLGK